MSTDSQNRSIWGAFGGPDFDLSEVFGRRHRGEAVEPHVRVEPMPRVPNYDEIARLVGQPSHPEKDTSADLPGKPDAGRGTLVSAR